MSDAVCHSNPDLPSQSLIKQICHSSIFNVTTKAVMHGCKHEAAAIAAYEKHMQQHHKTLDLLSVDFLLTKNCCTQCGLFVNKKITVGEVKCPLSLLSRNIL